LVVTNPGVDRHQGEAIAFDSWWGFVSLKCDPGVQAKADMKCKRSRNCYGNKEKIRVA
jgi:hypothetical protein